MSYRLRETPARASRPPSSSPINYNPFRPGKTLLWTSIGACTAVFAAWQYAASGTPARPTSSGWFGAKPAAPTSQQQVGKFLVDNFLLSTRHIQAGKYWTLVTSAFSHKDFNHLLFNMFGLHAFSTIMIYSIGSPVQLGALMLGSAVAGSAGYLYQQAQSSSVVPSFALGASGMVMGIGTAAAMLRPKTPMALFGIIPAPLWALVAGYVAIDSYYLDHPQSRIGHSAHLGGAVFGALYYTLFLRRFGGILGAFRR